MCLCLEYSNFKFVIAKLRGVYLCSDTDLISSIHHDSDVYNNYTMH